MKSGKKYIQLIGADEIVRDFKKLPDRIKPRAVRSIARYAASPIRAEARKIVPVGSTYKRAKNQASPGNLKKSIMIGSMRSKSKKASGVFVGPRYKRGKYLGAHGHLVAFGSGQRPHPRSGTSGKIGDGGFNPIGDFMQEAASRVKDQVLSRLNNGMMRVIDREFRKLGWR